jgi:hypothetical protein
LVCDSDQAEIVAVWFLVRKPRLVLEAQRRLADVGFPVMTVALAGAERRCYFRVAVIFQGIHSNELEPDPSPPMAMAGDQIPSPPMKTTMTSRITFTTKLRLVALACASCGWLAVVCATAQPSPTAESSSTNRAATNATNDPIARIRDEGLNRSQLMPTMSYLCDVIGPRLTGSPHMKRANEWTREKL